MGKYGKYFILIGVVSLVLGIGTGLLIKNLTSSEEQQDTIEATNNE